ncbi:MAG: hypothetical protein NXI20_18220 [bacterium]|nr:hypothetical protein [bacterium]
MVNKRHIAEQLVPVKTFLIPVISVLLLASLLCDDIILHITESAKTELEINEEKLNSRVSIKQSRIRKKSKKVHNFLISVKTSSDEIHTHKVRDFYIDTSTPIYIRHQQFLN